MSARNLGLGHAIPGIFMAFPMRRALGKGLSQLLNEEPESSISEVSLSSIVANPRQPRQHFNEEKLSELADSIKQNGLLQPIVVRAIGASKYEIIAGERRWRAAKIAGIRTVPVVVRTANSQTTLELALVENVQREDINAIECATAYRRLAEEFGLTQEQIALKVGKSRVGITNTMRLLKLPDEMQKAIIQGVISEGHARALLMIESSAKQELIFQRMVAEGLSVRESERLARGEARVPSGKIKAERELDPDWEAISQRISEHFHAKIHLDRKKVGGRISIDYYSDDELEGILEKMGIQL